MSYVGLRAQSSQPCAPSSVLVCVKAAVVPLNRKYAVRQQDWQTKVRSCCGSELGARTTCDSDLALLSQTRLLSLGNRFCVAFRHCLLACRSVLCMSWSKKTFNYFKLEQQSSIMVKQCGAAGRQLTESRMLILLWWWFLIDIGTIVQVGYLNGFIAPANVHLYSCVNGQYILLTNIEVINQALDFGLFHTHWSSPSEVCSPLCVESLKLIGCQDVTL